MQAIWAVVYIMLIDIMIVAWIAYGQPTKKVEKKKEKFNIRIEEN